MDIVSCPWYCRNGQTDKERMVNMTITIDEQEQLVSHLTFLIDYWTIDTVMPEAMRHVLITRIGSLRRKLEDCLDSSEIVFLAVTREV